MSTRRIVPNPRTLRGKLGIAAFLTTFILLASSTASFAYWQSSQSVSSTVGAANLTISTANLTGATFTNDTLVSTGSITATNTTTTTSTQSGVVTLTIRGSGASSFDSFVSRQLWPTTDITGCAAAAVPAGTTSSAWSASVQVTATLAPQNSASWCVRSVIASRDNVLSSAGSDSFTTSVSGTIALQNFSGTDTATATQRTSQMYTAYTAQDTSHWQWIRPNFSNASYNYCLDVSGASTASGTIVISYGCKTSGASNQNWMFTRVGSTNYFTIQPRHATNLRIDNGGSTTVGSGVSVVNSASTTAQRWSLQKVSAGVYQLVNALSGMCLTSPSGASQNLGQITQSTCTGGQFQEFLISQAFENFGCKVTNNNSSFVWSWTQATTGPYQVTIANGNTTAVLATTSGASANGVSVATSGIPGTGTYNVTFSDANGTVVGTGTITSSFNWWNSSTSYSCTANDLQ